MSALWEESSKSTSLTSIGTKDSDELFHNEVDDHVFASAPITIVDGIITLIADTTNLFRVKLVVCHESFVASDVQALGSHEWQNWYRFNIGSGPLVFRLRSKRTILPEHKLWWTVEKMQGADTTNCHMGLQMLMVRHQ